MTAVADALMKSDSLDPETPQALIEERVWAVAGERLACVNTTEKVLEEKERILRETIAKNYNRIRDVERELAELQMQLKLTSGPKKSALLMLRKKIEAQNEKVIAARENFLAARKVMEAREEALNAELRIKEQLCAELNLLVQQSAHAQLDKLEQLTVRLEHLTNEAVPREVVARLGMEYPQPASLVQKLAEDVTPGSSAAGSAPPSPVRLPNDEGHELPVSTGASKGVAPVKTVRVPRTASPGGPQAPMSPSAGAAEGAHRLSTAGQATAIPSSGGAGPPRGVRVGRGPTPATRRPPQPAAVHSEGRFQGFES
eukprot:jgi/Botrbrau1/14565/Bobra.27_3s0004.1